MSNRSVFKQTGWTGCPRSSLKDTWTRFVHSVGEQNLWERNQNSAVNSKTFPPFDAFMGFLWRKTDSVDKNTIQAKKTGFFFGPNVPSKQENQNFPLNHVTASDQSCCWSVIMDLRWFWSGSQLFSLISGFLHMKLHETFYINKLHFTYFSLNNHGGNWFTGRCSASVTEPLH